MQVEENKLEGGSPPVLPWRLTPNPIEESEETICQQPSGVVRVTEMLRQLNNTGSGRLAARRGSESEEERTSRRSSAGDSGLGNLSENELLDQDSSERDKAGPGDSL